ncbi:succinate dehydrogenase assembly factor 2 family protein [Aliidiomarina minuta]|uniref:FAD assembly factor SdhE n=1 Tax=Aliidiomarina minuta TaxID=880057 RepID=A0A432W720_9GAMM|nr:succinate dehydrogenase assembly factor 2 [Aliidiomarina minuta]RUO25832.1 succinate dehydrogenase assembly factor 2 family protein [Aliidiomarina minuta]
MDMVKQSAESLRDKNRLRWACRRGMLELDVLFAPFVEDAYDELTDEQKAVFRRLIICDDPDLFAWFMGHQKCPDPELASMVQLMLSRVKV